MIELHLIVLWRETMKGVNDLGYVVLCCESIGGVGGGGRDRAGFDCCVVRDGGATELDLIVLWCDSMFATMEVELVPFFRLMCIIFLYFHHRCYHVHFLGDPVSFAFFTGIVFTISSPRPQRCSDS